MFFARVVSTREPRSVSKKSGKQDRAAGRNGKEREGEKERSRQGEDEGGR